MVFGVVLFSLYYRHYHSKDAKASIRYSTIFAAAITLVSSLVFYQIYAFGEGSLTGSGIPWQFGALRAVVFMACAPAVAYAISKVKK